VSSRVSALRKESPSGRSFGFDAPDRSSPDKEAPEPGAPGQWGKHDTPKSGELVIAGSGFFISPDGYAVTNSHVVEESDTVEIRTHDDKTYTAKVVGKDSLSDLALIKVDGNKEFSYVKLADQPPRIGDWVLTAGYPFGLGGTVTAGIVSAHERSIEATSSEDLIQIDAPINKGDSGGPSFDVSGDVIGVNSMIFSPSGGSVGVAFAVPADTVKTVIPQLRDKGSVTRGWMGVQVQSVTSELAEGLGLDKLRGAIVTDVQSDSPAAKAGLARGDVIVSIGGQPIKDAHNLTSKTRGTAPGSSIELGLMREGEQKSVNVTLGQLPKQAAAPADTRR